MCWLGRWRMAAVTDVRAMSPQETSKWCDSLALCGVRGRVLRDLQDQILKRQIDGLLFDKLLRSNTLQDLGIEELTARLSLAIRRSWTTDFQGVSFIDYSASQAHFQGRMPEDQRHRYPASPMQAQVHDFAPQHRGPDPFANQRFPAGSPSGSPAGAVPQRQWPPTGPMGGDCRGRAPDGMAPPVHDLRASLGRGQAMERRGPPGAAQDMYGMGMDLRADPYGPINGHHAVMEDEMAMQQWGGGGQGAPNMRGRQPPRFLDHNGGYPDHAYADKGMGPPPPMPQSGMLAHFSQGGGQRGMVHMQGYPPHMDDVQHDPHGVHQRQRPQMPGQMQNGGWEGGLGEAFAPRRPAPASYAPEGSYDAARPSLGARGGPGASPAQLGNMESWGGGGLDDVMPPRQLASNNVAKGYADQARGPTQPLSSPMGSPMASPQAAAADWGGMSLGDALGPKRPADLAQWRAAANDRGAPQDQDFDHEPAGGTDDNWLANGTEMGGQGRGGTPLQARGQPQGSRQPQAKGGFSGLDEDDESFGLSGGSVPRSTGRSPPAAAAESAPRPSRTRPSTQPADDGWGGQSLGDALAPRKAVAAPTPSSAGGGSSGSRDRGGAGRGAQAATPSAGADCQKTPQEIITWVRGLPESHVPEKCRENIAAIVEEQRLGGREFSEYVLHVPPEVCAPRHAMKLKAAWSAILREPALREVALSNLANQPKQKATMIVV